jgi:hypothetical protein
LIFLVATAKIHFEEQVEVVDTKQSRQAGLKGSQADLSFMSWLCYKTGV